MSDSGGLPIWSAISSTSFLEYAFVRWVLAPAVDPKMATCVTPQAEAGVEGRNYAIDYEIRGSQNIVALELDGFAYHGSRQAFTYDRLRQNDLIATGRSIVRFSYDSIRTDTARCVEQLQAVLRLDPLLATMLVAEPSHRGSRHGPGSVMALASFTGQTPERCPRWRQRECRTSSPLPAS